MFITTSVFWIEVLGRCGEIRVRFGTDLLGIMMMMMMMVMIVLVGMLRRG